MTLRTASCRCGQLRAECAGEPVRISVCHCLNCKRRSGSAFAVQARFPAEQVTITGRSTEYVAPSESGGAPAHFHFCPVCGGNVWYSGGGIADTVAIPVGQFADPAFPAPGISVYESRQCAWLEVRGVVEHYD
ncbi:GFA family protein [Sphingomonas sp. HITSZ_GF]|uniref:GFA family protein n=1 Tax=Sphingomonas sp. HITSZ_GF TaxID=3037247 RepID=UPI00240E1192|nr:GFA family protein [Sphingomonas sp. HITSZ_GF]MDG2534636.1 GFA family protein [Sphingomonas sp. HITSZ_GF]